MMHPAGLPAAFGHGRNAGVGLEFAGGIPPGAVGAEGGRQPRRADGTGAGETGEEGLVGVRGEEGGDLAVERADRREQGAKLGRFGVDHETERVHDRRVGRQRLGGGDLREARIDHRRAAAVVLLIEPPDGGRPGALDGGQRGPLREKVTRLAGVEASHPVEGLGEVLLEQAGEPIGHRPTPG